MASDLEKLHQWVLSKYDNYLSMIAIGSIAVGDAWNEGRSDYDILLIFEEYPQGRFSDLWGCLKNYNFDETYLFIPILIQM